MTAPRPPGRPRSARADAAIVEAALALLADQGYAGLSVEAVAARAGVGKATIYRRWPSKEQLVVDALATMSEEDPPPVGESTREQLVGVLETVRRKSQDSVVGKIFPRLIGERDNDELMSRYREQVIKPRRVRVAQILVRGIERGDLRADLDVEATIDLLVGAMIYPVLLRPAGGRVEAGLAERIVDDLLRGLAPR